MSGISVSSAAEYAPAAQRFRVSTKVVLQGALLALTLGNVGRIPLLNLGERTAPLLINDLAVAAVIIVGAIAMVQARSLRFDDVTMAAVVFASIGALSTLAGVERFGLSAMEVIASLAYLARWLVYLALYVVLVNCLRASDSESIWAALETALLLITAFGIVQAIFLPDFAFMVFPDARPVYDFDQQKHRLVSTILEPNLAAGMILTGLLVQLARISTGARVPLWKPVLMFAGLVATLSRGAMLALVIGVLILLAIRRPTKRLWKLAAILFVLVAAALPKLVQLANAYARLTVTDASALARVVMWQRAIETFLEHPWFGIGFNTYGFVQERRGFERLGGAAYSVEGGLLFVAVLTGIVGLVVYLGMLFFVLRRAWLGWHLRDTTPAERGLLIGTAVATLAILVQSVFANSLLTPMVMEPLWVLWGLTFVIVSALQNPAAHGTAGG